MTRQFPADFGPVLYVTDLAEVLGLSVKRVHALDREGAFTAERVRPSLGRIAFSRDRLAARFGSGEAPAFPVLAGKWKAS